VEEAAGDAVGFGGEEPAAEGDGFGERDDGADFAAGGANGGEHGGLVGAGRDDVDVYGNLGGVEFHGHGFAHADSGGFGSAIGKKLRIAVAGAASGEEDNFSAAGRSFWGGVEPGLNEGFCDEERAGGIDAESVGEFFGVELPEIAGLAEFGGGVDDGIEAFPIPVDFSEEGRDGVRVGDIHGRSAVEVAELSGGFPDLFGGGGEPEAVACGSEITGDFEADASAAASDEDAG